MTGHQSLVENAGILHRDVSLNNVVINKIPSEGKPKGFLIDLDLVKDIKRMTNSGDKHKTGTFRNDTLITMASNPFITF